MPAFAMRTQFSQVKILRLLKIFLSNSKESLLEIFLGPKGTNKQTATSRPKLKKSLERSMRRSKNVPVKSNPKFMRICATDVRCFLMVQERKVS